MNRFEPPPLPGAQPHGQEPTNPYATPTGPTSPSPATGHGSAPGHGHGYGQGYGAAPQAPWGAPASHTHPRGTVVLVLGILAIVVAPLFGPFAWAMGRQALREVDAAPHPTSNRTSLQVGTVLGIVGTVFLIIGVVFLVGLVALAVLGADISVAP